MNISKGFTLGHLKVGFLVIIEEDVETVKNLCKKLMVATSRVELVINLKKTEFMKFSREDRTINQDESLEVDDHFFYRIPQFKYVGVILTQDNELKTKVSRRMKMANKCYFGIRPLIRLG